MSNHFDPPESFREWYSLLAFQAYDGKPRRPEVGSYNGHEKMGPADPAKDQHAANYLERVDNRLYRVKYDIMHYLNHENPNLTDLDELLKRYEQGKWHKT